MTSPQLVSPQPAPACVTPAEVKRFERTARIRNHAAFAEALEALIREKLAAALETAPAATKAALAGAGPGGALRVDVRGRPAATDIQRDRMVLLQAFGEASNLPLPEFAKLAAKSRQQIYKDLASRPPRLLALGVGPRRQRLPDWQLDPLRLRLTREVLCQAAGVDAWRLYHVLSRPLDALGGRPPVEAVEAIDPGSVERVARVVLDALAVDGEGGAGASRCPCG